MVLPTFLPFKNRNKSPWMAKLSQFAKRKEFHSVVLRSTGTVLTTSFTKGTRFSTVTTFSLVASLVTQVVDESTAGVPMKKLLDGKRHIPFVMATCFVENATKNPGIFGSAESRESACSLGLWQTRGLWPFANPASHLVAYIPSGKLT